MANERHCSECGGELPADAPQGLCPQCLMKLGLQTGEQTEKYSGSDKQGVPSASEKPPGGFIPPEPAELAKQFPQLEILELLGQGGMGAVYKARQKQLDRLVALKILPPEVGQESFFAERFGREARSMALLNHPNIITVHDFGQTDKGLYYFIMEFVDGANLRHVLQAGQLKSQEALAIVPQICEALQFAHEEGIVHRDIKPENILLDKKGRVKIADFGLAKLLDRPATIYTLTGPSQKMGTPHYMAPEQIERPHEVDHRADIYSLGVVFYEMLTGELPLGRFLPPSQKVCVDVRLDEVVLKSLEKEPERRYQHASEVKTDVETIRFTEGQAGTGHPSAAVSNDSIEAIRQRVWIPAAGLMVSGLINCLVVVGAVIGALVRLVQRGFAISGNTFGFLPGAAEFLVIGFLAAPGILVVVGAYNIMRLRSHRMAVAGSAAAVLPFLPGAIIGLPMGIWALVLLMKKEIKAAFGQSRLVGIGVSIPPKIREFVVSAVEEVKSAVSREKAEFSKLRSEKNPAEQKAGTETAGTRLGMAIASFVLGLVSIFVVTVSRGFATRFSFGFTTIFLAILFGVMAIKNVKNYRDQFGQAGFAIAGLVFAAISAVILLGSMTW